MFFAAAAGDQEAKFAISLSTHRSFTMKTQLFLAAFIAALTTSFAAIAADAPTTGGATPTENAVKAEKPKKKVKPHSHMAEKGAAVAPAEKTTTTAETTMPGHNHQKEHKGM
jgi:hypothetical protein